MIRFRPSFLRFCVVTSSVLFFIASAKAQEKVLLRMHLQPGQTFDQGSIFESKTSETVNGMSVDLKMTKRMEMHNEVLGVDHDGAVKLKMTYTSVAFESQMTDGAKKNFTLNYDSKKPSKIMPAGEEALTGLVGQSLIMTISPQGEILRVDGVDAIVKQIMTARKDTVGRDVTSKNFKKSIEDESKWRMNVIAFAEMPIAIGDPWKFQSDVSSTLTSGQYTLISLQNGIATLAVRSNTRVDQMSKQNLDVGVTTNLKGTQSGVKRIDENSGLMISSEMHGNLAGSWSIKNTNGKAKSVEIPFSEQSITRSWIVKLPQ